MRSNSFWLYVQCTQFSPLIGYSLPYMRDLAPGPYNETCWFSKAPYPATWLASALDLIYAIRQSNKWSDNTCPPAFTHRSLKTVVLLHLAGLVSRVAEIWLRRFRPPGILDGCVSELVHLQNVSPPQYDDELALSPFKQYEQSGTNTPAPQDTVAIAKISNCLNMIFSNKQKYFYFHANDIF